MLFHKLQAIILFAILVTITVPAAADANVLQGKVISIDDGDSIIIVDNDHRLYRIRLQGIDAPESGQNFSTASRENLAKLIFGKEVTVEWNKHDRYARIVGYVFIDSQDAGLQQVKSGLAWHYKYYQNEQTAAERQAYAEAEQKARAKKLGLWGDSDPTPPWAFRQGGRADPVKPVITSQPLENSQRYIRGPRGGCYYLNGSRRKMYVDHSLCN